MRRRALIVLAVVGLALTGCAGTADTTTTETPTPWPPQTAAESPSAEPTLSDAEAAEMVAATYRDFIDTSAQVFAAGGDHDGALASLLTPNMAEALDVAINFAESGNWQTSGSTITYNEELVERGEIEGMTSYSAKFCIDASNLIVTDENGEPIRKDDENPKRPVLATVVLDGTAPKIHETQRDESQGTC